MNRDRSVTFRLALALLASQWSEASLSFTCREFFGEEIDPIFADLAEVVVLAVLARYPSAPLDRARELGAFMLSFHHDLHLQTSGVEHDEGYGHDDEVNEADPHHFPIDDRELNDHDDDGKLNDVGDHPDQNDGDDGDDEDRSEQGLLYPKYGPLRMPVAPARMLHNHWGVPVLHTVGELAEFLEVQLNDVAWFADRRGMQIREAKEQLHHYTYRWIPKRDGTFRLLEQPKPRLKHLQRVILSRIIGFIPLHDAAHGFVSGRSAITAAQPHAGQRAVLRFDIQNFFGSVGAGKVHGVFRTCGYPEAVAHALTGIVTNRVPNHVIAQRRTKSEKVGGLLRTPHLPQGAPTSPALANLVAIGIDRRMSGLAKIYEATYTRYADDLFISGGDLLLARSKSFCVLSDHIVADEGFRLHQAKTTLMTSAGQQRMLGLVVNDHPAVARTEFDNLRATLHNCIETGPEPQRKDQPGDFRAHLLGRIGWIGNTNPRRAEKLMVLLNQISWS
jgi:RNA-directed DNA polymerase